MNKQQLLSWDTLHKSLTLPNSYEGNDTVVIQQLEILTIYCSYILLINM